MPYADRDQVRAALGLRETDTAKDTTIDRVLTAASTGVDNACHRSFGLDAGASTRLVVAIRPDMLLVDDIGSTTDLLVETYNGSAWTTVDDATYQAEPLNMRRDGQAWPITRLMALDWTWPVDRQARVRVTAAWGWPSVPAPVTEATILLTVRTLKRPDAPFGVTFGELGSLQLQSADPDIRTLLEPYERIGGIG